jgi:hypothetical protein
MTPIETPPVFDKPPAQPADGVAFAAMTRTQKCVYVAQVVICIATFGFVFPRI